MPCLRFGNYAPSCSRSTYTQIRMSRSLFPIGYMDVSMALGCVSVEALDGGGENVWCWRRVRGRGPQLGPRSGPLSSIIETCRVV